MQTFHCDTISVAAIGTTGQATMIIPPQPFPQKAVLCAQAPGIFVSDSQIARSQEGFALVAGVPVTFDLPADCGLYGLSAAGNVGLSRQYGELLDATALLAEYLRQIIAALTPAVAPGPPTLHETADQREFWKPIGVPGMARRLPVPLPKKR